MSFVGELRRRNVVRAGLAYAVTAWLALQVGDVVTDATQAPAWVMQFLLVFLAVGFLPVLVFSWAYEITAEGLKRERDIPRDASIKQVTARRLDVVIIVLMVVAIGLFVWESRLRSPAAPSVAATAAGKGTLAPTTDGTTPAADAAPPDKSIAVLPFVNLSSDPEQEYFSDGISEELLNVLARYPGLKVAARTSSFQFKGQNQDIGEIARLLNVRHVLEGSVRKSGTRLRITVQLIEADTGYHLWSSAYDRELDDVFAIQDEISTAIGEALRVQLALQAEPDAHAPRVAESANTAAYEAFLRGRHLVNQRGRSNITQAVEDLKRAVRLDPEFAPAHAWMAIAWCLMLDSPQSYGDLTLAEVNERARPHIEMALALNPNLAEAQGARALLAMNGNDYETVLEATARALELNPIYVDAMNWRSLAAAAAGDYATGLQILRRMVEVDPLSIVGRLNYSLPLALQDPEAARRMAESMIGQHAWAGYAAMANVESVATGDLAKSLYWSLRAYQEDPHDEFSNRAIILILAQVGEFEEARRVSDSNAQIPDIYEGRWSSALARLRESRDADPLNNTIQLNLADALHLAGRFEEAQALYTELQARLPNGLIVDTLDTSTRPMLRMAYGYRLTGDEAAVAQLLAAFRADLEKRQSAGLIYSSDHAAMAMAAALDGDDEASLAALRTALQKGLRDPIVLREPCMQRLAGDPRFVALRGEFEALIAAERSRVLKLICEENPVPTTWQPTKQTCQRRAVPTRT